MGFQRYQPPMFNVEEPFLGITVIKMNEPMKELLSRFISEISEVEPEIVAFGRALVDPVKSRVLRDEKQQQKRNFYRRRNTPDEMGAEEEYHDQSGVNR